MPKITWFGHSAFKLEMKGKTILIDPWLDGNPKSPVKVCNIDKADIVYVTHDHGDHLGEAFEVCKKTNAAFIATFELANYAQENSVKNVLGLNIGGSVEIQGIKLHAVQAFHTASKGAPTGVIIEGEGKRVYHTGDTSIFGDMHLIGRLYPLDLTLIPIGGHYTMDAFEAAEAVKLLRPKAVIPMHYGTFPILAQSAEDFVKKLVESFSDVKVVVLKPGESYIF